MIPVVLAASIFLSGFCLGIGFSMRQHKKDTEVMIKRHAENLDVVSAWYRAKFAEYSSVARKKAEEYVNENADKWAQQGAQRAMKAYRIVPRGFRPYLVKTKRN